MSDEIWREIAGTERDKEDTARYVYVATCIIEDRALRERTLRVMSEVSNRVVVVNGKYEYRFARRAEIEPKFFLDRVARHLPGHPGEITLVTRHELVPRWSWMSDMDWDNAYWSITKAVTGGNNRIVDARAEPAMLFGPYPHWQMKQFEMPARGVLTGHLVHRPLLGDLARLLALVGAYAAAGERDRFERAAGYVMDVAKAPPLIVGDSTKYHLIHVCLD